MTQLFDLTEMPTFDGSHLDLTAFGLVRYGDPKIPGLIRGALTSFGGVTLLNEFALTQSAVITNLDALRQSRLLGWTSLMLADLVATYTHWVVTPVRGSQPSAHPHSFNDLFCLCPVDVRKEVVGHARPLLRALMPSPDETEALRGGFTEQEDALLSQSANALAAIIRSALGSSSPTSRTYSVRPPQNTAMERANRLNAFHSKAVPALVQSITLIAAGITRSKGPLVTEIGAPLTEAMVAQMEAGLLQLREYLATKGL